MLNPFRLLQIYNDLNKGQSILQENKPMNVKISSLLTLFGSLAGTVGLPTLATNWVHSHLSVYMGFVVAACLLHAILPSLFTDPSAAEQKASGLSGTQLPLFLLFAFILCGHPLTIHAQTVAPAPLITTPLASTQLQNLYAAGASYNPGGSPGIAGTALYAHNLNTGATLPTFAFTVADAVTTSVKPFTVSTNIGVGIAQQVTTIAKVPIYMPTSAGVSWTGTNTGWSWTSGVLVPIKVKSVYLIPAVRFLKSSVSNNSGYQLMGSFLIGWGE